MTLQKQTLFVLPLLLATSLNPWPSSKPIPDPLPSASTVSATDSTLPYFPKLVVAIGESSRKVNKPSTPAMPRIKMNSSAKTFVTSFLKKNREDLEETAVRGKALFPVMEAIFAKHNLPKELKYLAVVESDLKLKARSHAGAVGYWQLMKGTAKELGLAVSGKTDERKQLRKSTGAAAKYLSALYKNYQDWLLVIAAYNAGPGVVNKAIKKAGSRNFWRLQTYLPAETRGHVKRYIAIHYFFENAVGETTLTKGERLAYEKELEKFTKLVAEQTAVADSTQPSLALPEIR